MWRSLQDVIGSAKLRVLTLQPLQLDELLGRLAGPAPGVAFGLADPQPHGLGLPSFSATEQIASHCDPNSWP
jgi:hypothetical protein